MAKNFILIPDWNYILVNFLKIFKHLHASLSTNRLCRTILDTPSTTHTALLALLAIFFLLKIISALFDSSGKENSFPIFPRFIFPCLLYSRRDNSRWGHFGKNPLIFFPWTKKEERLNLALISLRQYIMKILPSFSFTIVVCMVGDVVTPDFEPAGVFDSSNKMPLHLFSMKNHLRFTIDFIVELPDSIFLLSRFNLSSFHGCDNFETVMINNTREKNTQPNVALRESQVVELNSFMWTESASDITSDLFH